VEAKLASFTSDETVAGEEGPLLGPDEISKEDVQYATLLISDAINRDTSMYYVAENGKVASVWQGGDRGEKWGLILRHPYVTNGLSLCALVDMVLACLSYPTAFYVSENVDLAMVIIMQCIWGAYIVVAATRLKFMWKARGAWMDGAAEPPWLMVHLIMVFGLATSEWLVYWNGRQHMLDNPYLQATGFSVKCPASYAVFIGGWVRGWMWIYFNAGVRDALLTLLKVFTKLGPITALMIALITGHFFIFEGLSNGETFGEYNCGNYGLPDYPGLYNGCVSFGPGGDTWEALWNMYGLLTDTVHPDLFMWLTDRKWFTFVVIISYMFFTNLIGLNLLLAIVYGQYVEILEEAQTYRASLRNSMLDTAFEILDPDGSDDVTPQELLAMLRRCFNAPPTDDDTDKLEMIVRLCDNKFAISKEATELMKLQNNSIDREDLHELLVFMSVPLKLKALTKPAFRYQLELETLKDRLADESEQMEKDFLMAEIEKLEGMTEEHFSAQFKPVYWFAFEACSKFPPMCESIWPYYHHGLWLQIHATWFIFYLIFCTFETAQRNVTKAYSTLNFLSAIYQTFYVLVLVLAEARNYQFLHFFNPLTARRGPNYANLGLLFTLWIEFFAHCKHGCFTVTDRNDQSKFIVGIAALGKSSRRYFSCLRRKL
jgi:hypothetical protein